MAVTYFSSLFLRRFQDKKKKFIPDPGSGETNFQIWIRDKHPGSATLVFSDYVLVRSCL
jgi:hypothetical protein